MNEIEVISNDLPAISDESLLALADRAEKQIEAINKIKRVALKVTNANDWLAQGDRPYLAVSGAEKVARVFGISWRIDEPVYEMETDGHFGYTYKGYFTLGATTVECIGSRSTKDPFFNKYARNGEGGKTLLPPSEIDKGDVKKAAYTNLLGNGISRILGIRNMTWEELAEAGIQKGNVAGVKYNDKSKEDVHSEFSAKRQEHHNKIKEYLRILFGDDEKAKEAKLIELTTWTKTKDKNGKALDKPEKVTGTANYMALKNDQVVAILCSKLEKEIANVVAPEVCSECHAPIKNGKCSNKKCPESE